MKRYKLVLKINSDSCVVTIFCKIENMKVKILSIQRCTK